MSPLQAIVLDNWFPGVQDLELRKGSSAWATGFPSALRAIMPFSGKTANKLFASTTTHIYDITTNGAIGAAVVTCTSGSWSFVNFSNSGGNFLCAVNGADSYTMYDGTSWSNPAITGMTSSNLSFVTAHQRRLWFVEKNSMNLWYLGVESISGAASQFPVGALFKKGGYIVAIGSWTVDSGAGRDDMLVIVSSNGEIAVYTGTDPSSITTWSLIGVYDVAQPIGQNPLLSYGGDLLYLSKIGLVPMTRITQSSFLNASDEISYEIDGAFLDATANYAANTGWQLLTHKAANMLIVNVPASTDALSFQFVMNTITKAWCRFTGWNASCWGNLGSDVYFGAGTTVYRAWVGTNDNGAPIIGKSAQAYSNLGMTGQKQITLVRPNIAFSQAINLQLAIDADFRTFDGQTVINYIPQNGAALWDVSLWNTGIWDGGQQLIDPEWTTVPGDLGYLHSLRIQIASSLATVTWTSTDFVAVPAGIL